MFINRKMHNIFFLICVFTNEFSELHLKRIAKSLHAWKIHKFLCCYLLMYLYCADNKVVNYNIL